MNHQVRQNISDRIVWGRVPSKHWAIWAHLQVIDCTLGEDARHTAAAVVGMWDAYRSVQAKVVGQDPLELGLTA